MPDPLTVAILGAAFTESVRFLYNQASDLLRAYREGKSAGAAETSVEIPVADTAPLSGRLGSLSANTEALEVQSDRIIRSLQAVAPVAQGWQLADNADSSIEAAAADLRDALEKVIGQRITFVGEERDPSGTIVVVEQDLESMQGGTVVGIENNSGGDGSYRSSQRVKNFEAGVMKGYTQ